MTVSIIIKVTDSPTAEGFPLSVKIAHGKIRKQKIIGYSFAEHFLKDEQIVSRKHPDHDVLAPIIADIKIRAKNLILKRVTDVDYAMAELFRLDFSQIRYLDFAAKIIADMNTMAKNLRKANDPKAANRVLGNVRVYENVISQFELFATDVSLQNLDYNILMRFRSYQEGIGNKKSTVHLYLRTLRAIYNKGIAVYKIPDEKPFAAVFKGLSQKSYNSRKKYLDREAMKIFEAADLKTAKQKYLDLFLLQFYFGGCDLMDLYYLKKKQFRRGRVFFQRSKVDGPPIDLLVHPKAAALIEKYDSDPEYCFPWGKDKSQYITFRRTYQRALIFIQQKLTLEVLPDGGNISVKVARHTFANLAKRLMIDQDIIRELMGHERNDVDNFYKDKFAEDIRDKALFEIIGD